MAAGVQNRQVRPQLTSTIKYNRKTDVVRIELLRSGCLGPVWRANGAPRIC